MNELPGELLKGAIVVHEDGALAGDYEEKEVTGDDGRVEDEDLLRGHLHKDDDVEEVALNDDVQWNENAEKGSTVAAVGLGGAAEEDQPPLKPTESRPQMSAASLACLLPLYPSDQSDRLLQQRLLLDANVPHGEEGEGRGAVDGWEDKNC